MQPWVFNRGHLGAGEPLESVSPIDDGSVVIIVGGYRSSGWCVVAVIGKRDRDAMIEKEARVEAAPLVDFRNAGAETIGVHVAMSAAYAVRCEPEGNSQLAGWIQIDIEDLQHNVHSPNRCAIVANSDCSRIAAGRLTRRNMNFNPDDKVVIGRQRERKCVTLFAGGRSLGPCARVVEHTRAVFLCWNHCVWNSRSGARRVISSFRIGSLIDDHIGLAVKPDFGRWNRGAAAIQREGWRVDCHGT